ncbi:MAG: DSD1 family PLP-dependent enzyme [Clostridia bacterium]|nr:DSD1 family PLP-dependent enzyme [Clostridia bacterium]
MQMKVNQIPTPALILDLEAAERNQKKMMAFIAPRNLALRPHYKSHKSTMIAHMQLAGGAKGITCAKLSEAEDLILSGIPDVLIGNQVVDPAKIMRLAELAGYCHLAVCVDTEENIAALGRAAAFCDTTIYCLPEYDVGMKRCGVATHEEVLRLAEEILRTPHLAFMGIQAYAGNLAHECDPERRKTESLKVEADLRELLAKLAMAGIRVPEVSGLSTGTVELRPLDTVYTEAQTGTYLFMDAAYRKVGAGFEHALFMLTQVVSADDTHIVTDAGMKSLGVDQGAPLFCDYPKARVDMSEEHCAAYFEDGAKPQEMKKAGDKICLIPGHCCTTINLHDFIYLVKGDEVVGRIPVTSRGKSQ